MFEFTPSRRAGGGRRGGGVRGERCGGGWVLRERWWWRWHHRRCREEEVPQHSYGPSSSRDAGAVPDHVRLPYDRGAYHRDRTAGGPTTRAHHPCHKGRSQLNQAIKQSSKQSINQPNPPEESKVCSGDARFPNPDKAAEQPQPRVQGRANEGREPRPFLAAWLLSLALPKQPTRNPPTEEEGGDESNEQESHGRRESDGRLVGWGVS